MKCKCPSSYSAPAYVWALFSVVSACMCPFGLYFSNWIEKETNGTISSASSFRLCLMQSSRISSNCESYYSFNEMYSIEWKTVTLLIGIGACFLMLVALTSLFGLFVRYLFNKVVAVLTIIFQLLGGMLCTLRKYHGLLDRSVEFFSILCACYNWYDRG